MLRFTYTVDGDVQLDRALSRFGDALKDFRPFFQELVASFKDITRKQFESEGRQGSGGWAPLSADYAAWKQLHYPGKPILQLTGAMLESMTGGSDHIEEIAKDSLKVGTRDPKALYHQRGTSKMPARPVIQLNDENKAAWMKMLQRHAYTAAKEAGLA